MDFSRKNKNVHKEEKGKWKERKNICMTGDCEKCENFHKMYVFFM